MNKPNHIDQHAWNLINAGVDGELDAAGEEELRGLLVASREARQADEALRSLTSQVEELPELDPPEYLQDSIERQVRLPAQDDSAVGIRAYLGKLLTARWLRTGAALAAGVVLTVGVYEMGSEPISDRDARKLVGTVVQGQVPAQGILLDTIELNTDSVSGLVELRQTDDVLTLAVQLSSREATEVVVKLAGQGFGFDGISRAQNHDEAVVLEDGSVRVTGGGEQRYSLSLRRDANSGLTQMAPLELEFFTSDKLVHTASLSVTPQ